MNFIHYCKKCFNRTGKLHRLVPGKALTNRPKRVKRGEAICFGPGSPARMIKVLKCSECGNSISSPAL